MKIRIEAYGFTIHDVMSDGKTLVLELPDEESASLSHLLDIQLHINTADKSVLVNGAYVSPNYVVRDGDLVQILQMIQGG
jgi:sulfur carrier protein ThiS